MGWKAVSRILVILGSKYAGISLFQFDITELFNIELMEWFLVRKVAFEISDNSIQASSSYAGPSVYDQLRDLERKSVGVFITINYTEDLTCE